MTRALVLLSLLSLGCEKKDVVDPDDTSEPQDTTPVDLDGDGFDAEADCDDADPAVFPGAEEVCDGVDNDCSGAADDGATDAPTWFADADADGFGDPNTSSVACVAPVGSVEGAGDCDDADAAVHPEAEEVCDGVDNDCDGLLDDDDDSRTGGTPWYRDNDRDGYGNPANPVTACEAPTGLVAAGGDCDDTDDTAYPGAAPSDSTTLCMIDSDGDGWGDATPTNTSVRRGTDCDDGDAGISPDATEVCDEVDNDCDGTVDGPTTEGATVWYADVDGDGYGDPNAPYADCNQPRGFVADDTDCDDGAASTYPGARNTCTGGDVNCDGYADNDADGDGVASRFCGGTDCNDTDPNTTACTGVGTSASNPGLDCQDVYLSNSSPNDGLYWIDPDGDADPTDSFEAFCDMTTAGGGWTAAYWVDANHFDGVYANNHTSLATAPTAINQQSDMWNAATYMTFTEVLFLCGTQNDASTYYWTYNDTRALTWFTDTANDGYYTLSSTSSNTTTGTCFSTHSNPSSYGFVVIEDGSCGSCNTMLFGMYHYPSSSGCNSTSTTYGSHASPWNGRSIQYPICNRSQTSNGTFRIAVR